MDDLDKALAALPRADVGALTASSLRARAIHEFKLAHERMNRIREADRPRAARPGWQRTYDRVEPLLIAAVIVLYLGAAMGKLLAIVG